MSLYESHSIGQCNQPGNDVRANSRDAGPYCSSRIEVTHEEDDISKIRELLGICTDKRADRAGGAVNNQQSWRSSRALRSRCQQAYVCMLRLAGKQTVRSRAATWGSW